MTKPVSRQICRSVSEASDLLKRIGNANRLAIICHLMETEASVSAIEDALGIRQPTLSQQLADLRKAGIIAGRREGKAIVYHVVDAKAEAIVHTLRGLYAGLADVTGRSAISTLRVDDMMFD